MLIKQITMENNRRSFFKGMAAFAAGVVGAKVASYVPKKEEPKELMMVSSTITLKHGDEEYHPLVVKKTDADGMIYEQPKTPFSIVAGTPKIREAKI
jgi:hypothetical protein